MGVRLSLEWIEAAREHPGGFPWHLPYLEVARRITRVTRWCEHLLAAHRHRRIAVPSELVEVRRQLTALLDREGVRVPYARLEREVGLWTELRTAMRAERNRRTAGDLPTLAASEVVEVQGAIEEAGGRFVLYGEWAEAIWAKVGARFEAHRRYLWVIVPGLEQVVRSTVSMVGRGGTGRGQSVGGVRAAGPEGGRPTPARPTAGRASAARGGARGEATGTIGGVGPVARWGGSLGARTIGVGRVRWAGHHYSRAGSFLTVIGYRSGARGPRGRSEPGGGAVATPGRTDPGCGRPYRPSPHRRSALPRSAGGSGAP